MTSQETEFEIRKYIEKNPGKTLNYVAEHMTENGICSRMTTLKKIEDLKSREIVEDRQERNSFHRLYINNKNEFNRIDKELSELENVIDVVNEYIHVTSEYIEDAQFGTPSDAGNAGFLRQHMYIYKPPIKTILQFLLIRTNNMILSEKDKQVLYARIIKLMVTMDHEYFTPDWTKTLDYDENGLKAFLIHKDDGMLDPNHYRLANDLIEIIEKFKKEFSLTEQYD